jgi:hypothetical protein
MGAVLGTKTNNEISLFACGAVVLIPGESLRSPCRFALCCTHSEVDFLIDAFSAKLSRVEWLPTQLGCKPTRIRVRHLP